MNLSKIEGLLSSQKGSELFLALKIESDEAKSAFWTIEEGEVKILAFGTCEEWGGTKDELLVACDASVSSAITKLPQSAKEEPRQLILGLPNTWVKGNKIVKEKLKDLHFVTNKLSFQPIGFVVIPEAISFYLKNKSEDFFSYVLVYLGANEITVSLVHEGRVVHSEVVGRSDNLALDVEEGILRFSSVFDLPPWILLYNKNEENLEQAKQTLISYPWQPPEEKVRPGFLHLPRVDVLPGNSDIEAVAFAGGEEIKKLFPESREGVSREKTVQEQPSEKEILGEIQFVKGEDILKKEGLLVKKPETKEPEELEEPVEEESTLPPEKGEKEPFLGKIHWLAFFKRIPDLLPKTELLPLPSDKLPKKLFFGGMFLVVLFLAGFYFFAKAKIILTIEGQNITKDLQFQVVQGQSQIDLEKKIIPAQKISVEVKGTKKSVVTGKKVVGEKAKGEVIIYNRTDLPRTFSSGAILIGPGKLKFSLDQEVKIASKTPDLASGVDRWGEAKVSLTAEDIGAQYNVAGQSQFSFENLPISSFLAKNESAFSGGTSRQISVVSREDQEKLLAELEDELIKNAKEELKKKIGLGEILVWETFGKKEKTKKFDHEIQEESNELSLDLTLEGEALAFRKSDLVDLVVELSTQDGMIKEGMRVEKEKSEISIFKEKEAPSDLVSAKVGIVLKKEADPDEVVRSVKGRTVKSAEKQILNLEGVEFIEIKIYPGVFRLFPFLPFRQENIWVESKVN